MVNGLTEERLIGVNTPETSQPSYGEQPHGQEERSLLPGRR